jgi:hypothetical protein
MPRWYVQADVDGRWSVSMTLTADTSLAESRREPSVVATVGAV